MTVSEILTLAQAVLTGSGLVFVGLQVALQRRQVHDQVQITGFKLYRELVQQYLQLLTRADEHQELNDIWIPMDLARKAELDNVHGTCKWAVWFAMTPEEKRCYRYVRYGIETMEQAYQLHRRGWIDEATWKKWEAWTTNWKGVRYFQYVLDENRQRFIKCFVDALEELPEPAPWAAPPSDAPAISKQIIRDLTVVDSALSKDSET